MSNLATLEPRLPTLNHVYPRSPTLAGRSRGWVDWPIPCSATPSQSHGQNHAWPVIATSVRNRAENGARLIAVLTERLIDYNRLF
jgi:hypothetical protein